MVLGTGDFGGMPGEVYNTAATVVACSRSPWSRSMQVSAETRKCRLQAAGWGGKVMVWFLVSGEKSWGTPWFQLAFRGLEAAEA